MGLISIVPAGAPQLIGADPAIERGPTPSGPPASVAGAPVGQGATIPADADPPDADPLDARPLDTGFLDAGRLDAGPLRRRLVPFLRDTLPRLWSPGTLFGGEATHLFAVDPDAGPLDPGVDAILAVLGLPPVDALAAPAPDGTEADLSPSPAIDPARQVVHAAWIRLLATLAERLAGPDDGALDTRPLHLSNAGHPGEGCRDDLAFDRALAAAGIRVVHLDETPLDELVGLIRRAAVISAIAAEDGGDTLGTIAIGFSRPGARRALLCRADRPPPFGWLGALMLERAGGEAPSTLRPLDLRAGLRARDASAFAAALGRLGALATAPPFVHESVAAHAPGAADPRCAIDRAFTGRAQFRTAPAPMPWWQIDLGRIAPIRAVTVHAPLDEDCPADLRLLGSVDVHDWQILAERDTDAPFGSALGGGGPHVFKPAVTDGPWRVRGLRIQRTGHGVLALDQVEVTCDP